MGARTVSPVFTLWVLFAVANQPESIAGVAKWRASSPRVALLRSLVVRIPARRPAPQPLSVLPFQKLLTLCRTFQEV